MKRSYYATCVPGSEPVVEELLRREPGVVPEWSVEGAVLFRADQAPNFPYLHNVFLVLHTMRGLPDLDAAVKKLLLAGDWLDRMPYDHLGQLEPPGQPDQARGKRFRIVTMHHDRLAPVNMRYLSLLEKVIGEHTGLRVRRERPEVELWLIRCGERATVFAWRLHGRRADKAGAMRADLCAVMAALAGAPGGSAVCLGGDERLARALRAAGFEAVFPAADAAACAQRPDGSAGAVVGRMRAGGTQMRAALREVRRMLAPGGRAVLLAAEDMGGALDQSPGLAARQRYALRIGGRIRQLWVLVK
ncbi:MAG: hypothetical protein FWE77_05925 [Clostridia bacterium]|nr:hypothetical protein [Clostridia bacterium]